MSKTCMLCEKVFFSRRKHQKFCSKACKDKQYQQRSYVKKRKARQRSIRNQSRQPVMRICVICGKQWHPRFSRGQLVCSQNCSAKRKAQLQWMRNQTPEAKQARSEYMRKYMSQPKEKDRIKKYRQRPEVQEAMRQAYRKYKRSPKGLENRRKTERIYRNRPEIKEKKRRYEQRPEVKERRRQTEKERSRRPEVKQKKWQYLQRPDVKARTRQNSLKCYHLKRQRETLNKLSIAMNQVAQQLQQEKPK